VENITLLAMIQHSGLHASTESVATAGTLLHAGIEALKVNHSISQLYSQQKAAAAAAADDEPTLVSWSSVTAPFLARAELLLEFSSSDGLTATVETVPTLVVDDEVLAWPATSPACKLVESVRRFLVDGPDASEVRSVLAARASSVTEAEIGRAHV
jgi:hypothetical protein